MQRLTKIFLFIICTVCVSCAPRITNRVGRYGFAIPDKFNMLNEYDEEANEFVGKFFKTSETDYVLYSNEVSSALIAVVTYPHYINISKINSDSDVENRFLNELMVKFGNAWLLDKGSYSRKRLTASYIRYKFELEDELYIAEIHFFSGSISSTQSIYGISRESDSSNMSQALNDIARTYRRF